MPPYTHFYEGFILVSLLGVSVSASPPFTLGLVLVLIDKTKILKKPKGHSTLMLFVELRSLRLSWKLMNTIANVNTIKQFVQQLSTYFNKSRSWKD